MAFADGSTQYGEQQVGGQSDTFDVAAYLRCAVATYDHSNVTSGEQGTINMITLPPGQIRLWMPLCRIVTTKTSGFAVGATLSVGHAAYTDKNGENVAAQPTLFSGAGLHSPQTGTVLAPLTLNTSIQRFYWTTFETLSGLTLTATISTANMLGSVSNNEIKLGVVYSTVG